MYIFLNLTFLLHEDFNRICIDIKYNLQHQLVITLQQYFNPQ